MIITRRLVVSLLTPLLGAVIASAQEEVQVHAPYVATPQPVVAAMLNLAHTKRGDLVYDLGCGDGRIVIAAAKLYGAHGVGIDINPDRIEEARRNAKLAGVESLVRFEVGDVYQANLTNATVVTLYLLSDMNLRLAPKLKAELTPGARIVSHNFDMGNWKAKRRKQVDGDQVYLWIVRRKLWFLYPFSG